VALGSFDGETSYSKHFFLSSVADAGGKTCSTAPLDAASLVKAGAIDANTTRAKRAAAGETVSIPGKNDMLPVIPTAIENNSYRILISVLSDWTNPLGARSGKTAAWNAPV
jgi:hypothetical protein